jgi:SAM-dependent methyltransferase
LYDERYYRGTGADPEVDYVTEMATEDTVREYEWRGILSAVTALVPVGPDTRWLDYGCGLGGLVRWVDENTRCSILGFDEGFAAQTLAACGIAHLGGDDLAAAQGTFDVITAIEVLEHAVYPIEMLRAMLVLLRPGGLLFLTTGNARPFRERLTSWSYTSIPDVHVGFFEPATLALALRTAGFEVLVPGYLPGYDDVIRYKVLKSLHLKRRRAAERAVPWRLLSRIVDARRGVSAMPLGRRPVS